MPEDPNIQVADKPVEGVDFDGTHYDQTAGLTSQERHDWLIGKGLPKRTIEAEPRESPAPQAPAEGKPAEEMPKPAAESPSADQGEDRSPASFKRMRRQMSNWRDENVRLKARIAELEAQPKPKEAATPEVPKVDAAPASQSKSLTEALDKIEKDFVDGKLTYEQRMEARYDAKLEDRLARSDQESQQRVVIQKIGAKFRESAKAAREKYTDFDQVIQAQGGIGDKTVVPPGSIIEVRIMRSPVGAELAYHLGKNRAELEGILALKDEFGQPDVIAQSDAIATLEQKFTTPKVSSSPEPKRTRAPEPPVVLSGGSGPVLNEADRAFRDGNNRGYIEARNREALAQAKAGRS